MSNWYAIEDIDGMDVGPLVFLLRKTKDIISASVANSTTTANQSIIIRSSGEKSEIQSLLDNAELPYKVISTEILQ